MSIPINDLTENDYLILEYINHFSSVSEEQIKQHFDGKILYRPFDVDSNFMIRVDNLNSKDMPNLATQEISSMVSKLFTPSMYSFEDSYNYETGSFNVDILNELALNGDKDAIITLGLLYSYGLDGVEYDYYKAQNKGNGLNVLA